MKNFLVAFLAVLLLQGVMGAAPDLPDGVVGGAPTKSQQIQAATEILISKCGVFWKKLLCLPEEIVDAQTGKDGNKIYISIEFKVCCYGCARTFSSGAYLVKGVLETTPGGNVVAITQSSATKTTESCKNVKELDALTSGDSQAKATLQRADTLESKTSFGSGTSGSFFGFDLNSKQFVGGVPGDLGGNAISLKLDVRGKISATEGDDFDLCSLVWDGKVLCIF
eukprot:TRINITY_DN25_c1_g4_i1.p1 TRINITY_DN25_c1_g4~~TRINITY_DN25_c1_g4_i1.p1  ORF type:complete len:263 (+),score=47.45 TRINITY_DN25_c1_g4_i1:119-790(+)